MNTHSSIYIAKVDDYDSPDIIAGHLQNFFSLAGGVEKFIKPGMNVLIKPNLCLPHPPDKNITSHPVVIEQAVRIAKDCGAKKITIGDNPIGKTNKSLINKIWDSTGVRKVANRYNCEISLLDREGFARKSITLNGKKTFYFVSLEYLNSDVVINIPKFKSHALMGFTGAVKNIYGTLPGRSKLKMHSFAPGIEDFAKVIANVYSQRPPDITIMDAIEGMEGNGPGVKGKTRHIGILAVSNDGVLIDTICTRIMGLNKEDILTTVEAEKKGLGNSTPNKIWLSGLGSIDEAVAADFILPTTMQFQNSQVIKKIFDIAKFKMAINAETCRKCLLCFKNCPVRAIRLDDILSIDTQKCIQCLCCLEICPYGAINASMNKFYQQLKTLGKEGNHGCPGKNSE